MGEGQQSPERMAEVAVRLGDGLGLRLDFSRESLARVDSFLDQARKSNMPRRELGLMLYVLGCYAGEVLIRTHGGDWTTAAAASVVGEQPELPICLIGGDIKINAVKHAFRRYAGNDNDSLVFLFDHVADLRAPRH